MNGKQIGGLIALLIGIGLLIYGFHGKQQMTEARQKIDSSKGILPQTPFTETLDPITKPIEKGIKDKYLREVDSYELPLMLCFIASGVFMIGGLSVLVFCRNKKKK